MPLKNEDGCRLAKYRVLVWSLFLAAPLLAGGCSFFAPEPAATGVFEYDKVVRESIVWRELNSLTQEIAGLEESLREKKSILENSLKEKEEAAEQAVRKEWAAALKAREEQINEEFQEKYKDLLEKQNQKIQDFIAQTEAEANRQLAALAEQAALSEDEIKARAREIKEQAEEKIRARHAELGKEIEDATAEDRANTDREMRLYADELAESLRARTRNELRDFAEELLGDDQKRQNELKERHTILTRQADEDLRRAAARAAEAKDLTAVITNFVANPGAIDLTDDIIKELNRQQ
jgi:Skp family chaperone for outer membrane proteins